MKYNSENYSITIHSIEAGSYFLGSYIPSDTIYFIAYYKGTDTTTESFKDQLNEELKTKFLQLSKDLKVELIKKEDDENLRTAFEYPTGSGDSYSVARDTFQNYNSLSLYKSNFSYPFFINGNDGSSIMFNTEQELENFIFAALSKNQEIYTTRYAVAIEAIDSVVIETTLESAIEKIMEIIY